MAIVSKRKVKDGPHFCFMCGCTLADKKYEYVMSFGTPSTTDNFCRSCLKKIVISAEKQLSK